MPHQAQHTSDDRRAVLGIFYDRSRGNSWRVGRFAELHIAHGAQRHLGEARFLAAGIGGDIGPWKAVEQSGSGGLETERIFLEIVACHGTVRVFDSGSGTKGNWGTRSCLYCSRARSASSKDSRYPGPISTTSRLGWCISATECRVACKDTGSGHAAVLDGMRLYCDCLCRCSMLLAGPVLTEVSSALPKRDRMLSSFCSIFLAWLRVTKKGLSILRACSLSDSEIHLRLT